jgi:hypothetical protein
MKRIAPSLAVFIVLAGVTGNLFAQVDVGGGGGQAQMVKERAKRVRDANNTSQGVPTAPPPPAPGMPPAAQPVPAGPRTMDPAQQQLVDKVQSDLFAIKSDAVASADQKQNLETDLLTLAKGTTKPSKESVSKLTGDLAAALSGKNVTVKDPAQLAKAMNVVMNNGNVTPAQAQSFVTATQKILQAGGVGEAEVTAVVADLKAIIAELQKNKAHTY